MTAFVALDAAGLRYAERTTSDGTPYAGFAWASRDAARPVAVTVLAVDGVLRLTAHDVARDTAGGLARLHFTTKRLPRGRLFRAPGAEGSDLAVTLWGDRRRDTAGLWAALTYLEDVRDWLAGDGSPPGPAPDPEPVGTATADGVTVALGRAPEGHLVGRASVPGPALRIDAPTAAWVDELQWWAPAGRFLLGDGETLVAEVSSVPLRDEQLRLPVARAVAAMVGEAVRRREARGLET